jgi:hypothetical protein
MQIRLINHDMWLGLPFASMKDVILVSNLVHSRQWEGVYGLEYSSVNDKAVNSGRPH